jgi:hypothetical protein
MNIFFLPKENKKYEVKKFKKKPFPLSMIENACIVG